MAPGSSAVTGSQWTNRPRCPHRRRRAFGSDKADEDVAPVQVKVVEALGLSHLDKVA
jgi:hypothetical protein